MKARVFVPITRDEAQAAGLVRYYTGQPCKRGHLAERFVSNGGCVLCLNRQTRTYLRCPNAVLPTEPYIFDANTFNAALVPRTLAILQALAPLAMQYAAAEAEREALAVANNCALECLDDPPPVIWPPL